MTDDAVSDARQRGPLMSFTGEAIDVEKPCRSCGVSAVTVRTWESSDGGFEDYRYECGNCSYVWWIDGPDA